MTPSVFIFLAAPILFLLLLVWILRDPAKGNRSIPALEDDAEFGRRHVTFFPQIRQALSAQDLHFLGSKGSRALARKVRKDRRKIVLIYLARLRADFMKLWQLARVVARMSPRLGASGEFARFRLALSFCVRYELFRLKFLFGSAPLPDLTSLTDIVSSLALRLETAMNDLGERAALAADLVSTLDGRGLRAP